MRGLCRICGWVELKNGKDCPNMPTVKEMAFAMSRYCYEMRRKKPKPLNRPAPPGQQIHWKNAKELKTDDFLQGSFKE